MPKQPAAKSVFKDQVAFFLHFLVIVIILSLVVINLNTYFKTRNVLGLSIDAQATEKEIGFWEDFLTTNKNYLDGWVELARLKSLEGDIVGAKAAYLKAIKINPNSEKLTNLKNSF